MYDTAIIGTGPAGISAAMNLKLYNKDIIWFGAQELSNKVSKSEKIANYPGMGLITGQEMNLRMDEHRAEMELEITDRMVTNVTKTKTGYMLLAENDIYEARTLLLATGVIASRGLEGEAELLGRGVSYCATCDGFLYQGKTIAVFCAAPRYEHEAEYLAGIADKVYMYTSYSGCGIDLPNVSLLDKPIRKILGDERVRGMELADGRELSVDGVFILRNAVAPAALLPGLAMDGPHIVVDRTQATNHPGCYAAGDCTGRPYQIAKAVGEGNVAAHSIVEYLGVN